MQSFSFCLTVRPKPGCKLIFLLIKQAFNSTPLICKCITIYMHKTWRHGRDKKGAKRNGF